MHYGLVQFAIKEESNPNTPFSSLLRIFSVAYKGNTQIERNSPIPANCTSKLQETPSTQKN